MRQVGTVLTKALDMQHQAGLKSALPETSNVVSQRHEGKSSKQRETGHWFVEGMRLDVDDESRSRVPLRSLTSQLKEGKRRRRGSWLVFGFVREHGPKADKTPGRLRFEPSPGNFGVAGRLAVLGLPSVKVPVTQ